MDMDYGEETMTDLTPEALAEIARLRAALAPSCDHGRMVHLRPVVLMSWRVGDFVTGVARYSILRCYACGRKWAEDDANA